MKTRGHKRLVAAETVLLLLPLTVVLAAIAVLSYPAYPIPLRPLQVIFDVGMLFKLAGIVAGWRLALGYLRHGRNSLAKAHWLWVALLGVGSALGLVGGAIAIWHAFNPANAPDVVGYALFAPSVLLVPLLLHLWREQRRSTDRH